MKLAAGVGLWLGWLSWPVLLAGIAFGQILITICYLVGRRRSSGRSGTPLGPAITAGFVLALLLADLTGTRSGEPACITRKLESPSAQVGGQDDRTLIDDPGSAHMAPVQQQVVPTSSGH